MKKNFFKKLSFVMASAMLITAIAPAAGANAATSPALNSTKKYLHLSGISGKSEYDFNVNNKQTGWKYAWTTANENVAEVDNVGLATATGVGSTKVSVKITKSGKTVKTLSATVVVRDNIETVKIANAPEKDLAVDAKHDFNRTFVTEAGSTTKTSSITRWSVDKTTATIDNSGIFTATEAGEYKVTAMAFQSAEKYEAWKVSKAADLVLATDEVTVKVAVGIKEIKLVTPTQFNVTFDSSVKDIVKTAADVSLKQVVTSTISAFVPVKSVTVSEDGKVATVSVYDRLADKVTYTVGAAGATTELYAQIGTPVSISLKSQTIPAGTATALTFSLIDQYGVDVSSLFVASVDKSSTVGFTTQSTGALTLANNQVAFVKYSYNIINADGTVNTISTDTVTVTGVTAAITGTVSFNLYGSASAGDTAFATAKTSLALGTTSYLYARALKSDNSFNYAGYTYDSLNPSILVVDKLTGLVTPIAVGTAVVKVTDSNSVVVGYASINVTAAAATSSVKASTNIVRLSNNIVGATPSLESAEVTFVNVDQYGAETAATIKNQTTLDTTGSYVANATRTTDIATISTSGNKVTFEAVAGKTGSFTYVVRTSEDKLVSITVTVATPGILNNYSIEATATSVDAYADNADTDNTIGFTVYGKDAAGYKQALVTAATYTVTGPTGFTTQTLTPDAAGKVTFTADDTSVVAVPAGTYTLTVAMGGINYAQQFTVKNTRALAALSVSAYNVTAANGSTVLAAIENALELTIGSTHTAIQSATYVSSNASIVASTTTSFDAGTVNLVGTGTITLFVKQVKYNAGTVSAPVIVTVDVNKSITVTVQ